MFHMCFSKALVAKPINQLDQSKQILTVLRISCTLCMCKHLSHYKHCKSRETQSRHLFLKGSSPNFHKNSPGEVSVDESKQTNPNNCGSTMWTVNYYKHCNSIIYWPQMSITVVQLHQRMCYERERTNFLRKSFSVYKHSYLCIHLHRSYKRNI